jgi:hypothetical protein
MLSGKAVAILHSFVVTGPCCSRRSGERFMASVSRFLTNKLRLKVNAGRAKAGFRSCRCGVAQKCDAKQIEAACRFRLTIFESLRCRRGPGVDR